MIPALDIQESFTYMAEHGKSQDAWALHWRLWWLLLAANEAQEQAA